MKENGESVHGCTSAGIGKPEYGRITRKGGHLYYHVMESQIGGIPLPGIKKEDIDSISMLCGGNIKISNSWITSNYPQFVYVDLGENPVLPDTIDTVIEVVLKDTSDEVE